MKIKNELPPNYSEIISVLPRDMNAVFCYGDTLYNPFNRKITPDVEVHEQVHSKQQGDSPEMWYNKYLYDKDFRLRQEVEAYGTQYAFAKKFVRNKEILKWAKEKMVEALSSKAYGKLVTQKKARKLIETFAIYGKIV